MRFDELSLGQTATIRKTITQADIEVFAGLTGDFNPIHMDAQYAGRTRFGGRIAHGMLTAGLVSQVLGMRLPGTGAVYLSQTLRFKAPVRAGDTIEARAEVLELMPEKRRVRLRTLCVNQSGDTVLDGEALMLVDDVPTLS
ncbi:MAG TPA: MaoC family dehydratase [Gemmatimonadales bacterium]|jgi:3-hydroxybutyryl-CoA dehydratase